MLLRFRASQIAYVASACNEGAMKLRVKRSSIRTVLGFVLCLSAFTGTTFPTIVNAEPPALPPEAAPVERLREDTKATAAETYQWGPLLLPSLLLEQQPGILKGIPRPLMARQNVVRDTITVRTVRLHVM